MLQLHVGAVEPGARHIHVGRGHHDALERVLLVAGALFPEHRAPQRRLQQEEGVHVGGGLERQRVEHQHRRDDLLELLFFAGIVEQALGEAYAEDAHRDKPHRRQEEEDPPDRRGIFIFPVVKSFGGVPPRGLIRFLHASVLSAVRQRVWPLPVTMYLQEQSSLRPIGPRACSFWVEMPISAPKPNSPPSVKRVDALT